MLSSSEKTVFLDGWRSGYASGITRGMTEVTEQRMRKAGERGVLALSTWDHGYLFGELYGIAAREVRARGTEADGGETPSQAPRG